MRSILIVDSDLGFVFWLGRALHDAGYEALPAKDVPEATAIIGRSQDRNRPFDHKSFPWLEPRTL